ncbi:MAG: hypothetical protein R3C19_23515 [Planctomycetaceae bacterium]
MSIERAEQLKRELTDKWVVVAAATPELRRFAEYTGRVKTVNMNCRALVEFDGPVDISWYDIDPAFLTVVDAPKPKKDAGSHAKPAAKAAPESKPASKPAAGGSPLDAIRASGGGAKPKPAPAGGSPLDKIRASAGGAASAPAKKPAGGSPLDQIRASAGGAAAAPEKKPAGGSPLDQIRASAGGGGAAPAVPAKKAEPKQQAAASDEPKADAGTSTPDAGKPPVPAAGQSPLDLIRARNAAKNG